MNITNFDVRERLIIVYKSLLKLIPKREQTLIISVCVCVYSFRLCSIQIKHTVASNLNLTGQGSVLHALNDFKIVHVTTN